MNTKNIGVSIGILVLVVILWVVYKGNTPTATIDYKNATYQVENKTITLVNGEAETDAAPGAASKITTRYFGNSATGDLNADDKQDVAFILTQSGSGSGTFYYIVASLSTATGYKGTNAILLGDRISPQSTEINNAEITVNYADRLATDPMTTAPSIGTSKYFKVVGGNLMVSDHVVAQTPIQLCFYKETPAPRGLKDMTLLTMNLDGTKVTGELQLLPAEKDKKVGTFEGTVTAVDKMSMTRSIDAWWDSMAEGMQVKEQLKIVFGEGTADIGYGEMVDRGDGVYVYKTGAKITYSGSLSDTACEQVNDRIIVDRYIRANIKTLAVSKPVLGGSWYITSITLDPVKKTGTMMYEDGHVQGKASFSYTRSGDSVTITNIKKQ